MMGQAIPPFGGMSGERDSYDFRAELLSLAPFLRAFAWSLCGNRDDADDLAQDTLIKAWQARDTFVPGTNLKAWLFTIQRNQFYSTRRKASRQVAWSQEAAETIPGTKEDALWSAELSDLTRALHCLPDEQREALILVGAGGFSYDEAAKICGCAVGTVKSRTARARASLLNMLDGESSLKSVPRPDKGAAAGEIVAQLDQLSSSGDREAASRQRNKRNDV